MDILNKGDVCPLFSTTLIMLVLGNLAASERQRKWGVVIGILGFLGYGAYALQEFPPRHAADVFAISVRSLAVFGLLLGLSWLTLPLVHGLVVFLKTRLHAARAAAEEEHAQREREEKTRQSAHDEEEAEKMAAPEKEQLKKEAEAAKTQAQKDQKQREDSRARNEIFYRLNKLALASRLDKATFDEWVLKNMNDQFSPEQVEQREKEIRGLMELHLLQIETAEKTFAPKAERMSAIETAKRFYVENPELATVYPQRLLEAFLRKEMGPQVEPEQCWDACVKLITDLQGRLQKVQEEQRKQEQKQQEREMKIKEIDKKIEEVNTAIRLQRDSPIDDEDVREHEIHALQKRLREYEIEREKLKGGDG